MDHANRNAEAIRHGGAAALQHMLYNRNRDTYANGECLYTNGLIIVAEQ